MILSIISLNIDCVIGRVNSVDLFRALRLRNIAPSRDIIFWASLLILAQVADAILTLHGLSSFGSSVEGNIALRYLADSYGHTPAILLAKSIAIGLVVLLVYLSRTVAWVRTSLICLNCVYALCAIGPWTYLFFV